ncbi:MAG: electron transfer flavoprotein subunit alpha/FixB family protein [Deltaproteobacteria bacterium]|nr:electron transfer flavoprotein subunit alpha/FixB family protein [Deltaproteobacteria bacterium]
MKQKLEIWVFGDYRNYFQNRVTLQLIGKAVELAKEIKATVCAVVIGHELDEWIGEYIAHGARRVYVVEDPVLKEYDAATYAFLTARLAEVHKPDILLVGATSFGREFAPRVAKRLKTGLTADCVGLAIDQDSLLVQTAPSFGGNLLADIVTPKQRPQMATVRPGIFREIPHNYEAKGKIIRMPLPIDLSSRRLRLRKSERQPHQSKKLEDAAIVICSGRGIGSRKKFNNLYELAGLTDAEVGATRPLVYAGWAGHDSLVGQAGKIIRPKILFSFGVSGAIQHTAAVNDAEFIIAVNKNPKATMMKMADVAIVADAGQVCSALIRELKKRIR